MSTTAPATSAAWRIVAEREITTKIQTKSFRYGLLAMVVAIIALIVLFSALSGRPSNDTVAVADAGSAQIVKGASTLADQAEKGSTIKSKSYGSVQAAEAAVRDGKIDVALLPAEGGGYDIVGDDSVSSTLSQYLTAATSTTVLAKNAQAEGVDLSALSAGAEAKERLLDPEASSSGERQAAGTIFVILFYFTAVIFGLTIAQSVVQEKESRVVEILVAAIPVRALLWGKVVGNSVLALGQIVLLSAVAAIGLAVTGKTEFLSLIAPALGWGVVFFALGFVALSGLWAVAGSIASRTEDIQSTTMPGQVLLFVPYLIAVSAGATVKAVTSMVPIASAMVMPMRLAEGSVPAWQLAVAVLGNVIAIVVLVRLAARIYQRTLMRTEGKLSYKEAFSLSE